MSSFVGIHPLIFLRFSLIPNVFIDIREYANKITLLSDHSVKLLCLKINLVPHMVVYDS